MNLVKLTETIVKKIVKETMENTYKLDVPLKVEIDYGKSWYDTN